jgi:hypothetical protein
MSHQRCDLKKPRAKPWVDNRGRTATPQKGQCWPGGPRPIVDHHTQGFALGYLRSRRWRDNVRRRQFFQDKMSKLQVADRMDCNSLQACLYNLAESTGKGDL